MLSTQTKKRQNSNCISIWAHNGHADLIREIWEGLLPSPQDLLTPRARRDLTQDGNGAELGGYHLHL